MREFREGAPITREQVSRLLEGSTGPAFDMEDLALALRDGSAVRYYRIKVSAFEDLRRAVVTLMPPEDQNTVQIVHGVVGLLRIPTGLPLALSIREATALLHEVAGAHVHLVIAAIRLPVSEASVELNLWISPSEPT